MLPRISNHTDFDPLRLHPDIDLQFIKPTEDMPTCDLIILPGTKNTLADLQWLRDKKWDQVILKHLRYGGKVMGICGGLQMLGLTLGAVAGLKLLNIHTHFTNNKKLENIETFFDLPQQKNIPIKGYEIHEGLSNFDEPIILSDDNQILATYIHGLFDHPTALNALLNWAGCRTRKTIDIDQIENEALDRLADCCEQHLPLIETAPLYLNMFC
jgi:adenosylcobyric acid synthase